MAGCLPACPPATVMAASRTRYTTPSASGAPLASPLLGRSRTMSCGDSLCGGSGSLPPPCGGGGRAWRAGGWLMQNHGSMLCWDRQTTAAENGESRRAPPCTTTGSKGGTAAALRTRLVVDQRQQRAPQQPPLRLGEPQVEQGAPLGRRALRAASGERLLGLQGSTEGRRDSVLGRRGPTRLTDCTKRRRALLPKLAACGAPRQTSRHPGTQPRLAASWAHLCHLCIALHV